MVCICHRASAGLLFGRRLVDCSGVCAACTAANSAVFWQCGVFTCSYGWLACKVGWWMSVAIHANHFGCGLGSWCNSCTVADAHICRGITGLYSNCLALGADKPRKYTPYTKRMRCQPCFKQISGSIALRSLWCTSSYGPSICTGVKRYGRNCGGECRYCNGAFYKGGYFK